MQRTPEQWSTAEVSVLRRILAVAWRQLFVCRSHQIQPDTGGTWTICHCLLLYPGRLYGGYILLPGCLLTKYHHDRHTADKLITCSCSACNQAAVAEAAQAAEADAWAAEEHSAFSPACPSAQQQQKARQKLHKQVCTQSMIQWYMHAPHIT